MGHTGPVTGSLYLYLYCTSYCLKFRRTSRGRREVRHVARMENDKFTQNCVGVFQEQRLGAYLLTPWSRVLPEKLTGSAATQEIPALYETRKFITVFTSARHLSLS